MNYTSTITKSGQVTLPKPVRDLLGLNLGQRVTFNVKNKNTITIEKEKTAAEIAREIDAAIPEDVRENAKKIIAGRTAGEFREDWLKSDEAKKYYGKKYGIHYE